jgi:hypothetical protein
MEGFYMSANIIRLLPDEERAVEVPTDAVPDRLQKSYHRMKKPTNKIDSLTWGERMQLERFERHRERFMERKRWVGFCRWMASRHRGTAVPATDDTSHKEPES